MSPTPVTTSLPTAPVGYSWEATDEQVAERYGLPVDQIVRFDLNTSPAPPDLVDRILAAGRFETRLSEYPPSDYRRLVAAASARYGVAPEELIVGAGADEILDLVAKAFLPAGATAVIPTPSYAMYRVLTEQRGATVRAVARSDAAHGYAIDIPGLLEAAGEAQLVWLCSPNNPTALPEPDGSIATILDGLLASARAAGRTAPVCCLDEAYAEFVGTSLVALRARYPRLVVVRTLSKAYALAGLRVGFAIAARPVIAAMEPYRPPGSVSTVSVTIATEALLDPAILDGNLARVVTERERLSTALRELGWAPGPSVTNFLLVDFADPVRAAAAAEGLLRRGLVPRTFPPGHPLAGHLRLTVRSAEEDERLIVAAREIRLEPAEDAP